MKPIPEPRQGLTKRELRGVKLFIGTPCYMGQIGLRYADSLHLLTRALDRAGVDWMLKRPNGEMVARARNRLVVDFLETDCTHLLQIDSDISVPPQAVLDMLTVNVHIIGGLYPKKHIDWERVRQAAIAGTQAKDLQEAGVSYCFNPIREGRGIRGSIEVAEIGTGLLLTARATFTRLIRAYPETLYRDDYDATRGRKTWALFDYGVHGQRYLSEDYLFCQRWRAIGGRVFAWPHAPIAHQGSYIFRGDFRRRLKPKTEKTHAM